MSSLMHIRIHFILHMAIYCFSVSDSNSRFSSGLTKELYIQAVNITQNPIFKPQWRYDNSERNTSAAYDLWNRSGYHLFEWPGNITQMDSEYPLLRWGKSRSKFVQSPCETERGMELATYAHKYLHLTWGANRLTSSYCSPLRVRRQNLPKKERSRKEYEVVAVDFDFVFDALLVVTEQGYIVRVSDIEITYRRSLKIGKNGFRGNLTYTTATGINVPVNRVITQKCCSKSIGFCTHGETVVAFRESSFLSKIFISYNGGKSFQELLLQLPENSSFLHSILFYPTWNRIIAIHGTFSTQWLKCEIRTNHPSYQWSVPISHTSEIKGYLSQFNTNDGSLNLFKNQDKLNVTIHGFVQSSRINFENSFLVWDECHVWYGQPSKDELQVSEAVFYIHSSIRTDLEKIKVNNWSNSVPHVIRYSHCHFGRNSVLATGDEGKIGLLDRNNIFFYGVDLKSVNFPLIGLTTDMTLMLPEKRNTICPCFDRNNRPKLLYPPRYLRLPDTSLMDKNYDKRLSMRVVKKTLFPTDFMPPFWDENLKNLQPIYKYLAIPKCKTSSISVDGSLTQKVKSYKLNWKQRISLTVTFTSSSNASEQQLHYEPKDLSTIFNIDFLLHSVTATSEDQFWFKYRVDVTLNSVYKDLFKDQDMFYMNLFTFKSLRCIHQPQYPLWITVDYSFQGESLSSLKKNKNNQINNPSIKPGDSSEILKIHHCPLQRDMDSRTHGVCTSPKSSW